jgi:hypothetical protein
MLNHKTITHLPKEVVHLVQKLLHYSHICFGQDPPPYNHILYITSLYDIVFGLEFDYGTFTVGLGVPNPQNGDILVNMTRIQKLY